MRRGNTLRGLERQLAHLEQRVAVTDHLEEASRAALLHWLATRDEAAGLVLDYEEQLEAAGSQLAMYQSDEGRAVILAMVESMYELG